MADTSMYDPSDNTTHNMTTDEAHDRIRKTVVHLFDGPDKLQTTGGAFVVFRYSTDQAMVREYAEKNPNAFKLSTGETLQCSHAMAEPTSVTWWSAGLTQSQLTYRAFRALGIITCLIVILMFVFNFNYYWFIQRPYRDVGQTATGITTAVYGIIQSNITGLVHWGIYMIGESIGFRRKDSLYVFVFVTSVFFIAILEGFAIALLLKVEVEKYNQQDVGAIFTVSTKYLGVEMSFSRTVFNFLFGKWTGQVMKALMPQICFMWFQTLQKILYVWRCLPDPLLKILKAILPWKPDTLERLPFRNAEKGVDPWEIPFFADYADWVVVPLLCFVSMMFMSNYVWKIFLWLMCWAIGNYFYFRWMHLRFHRVNFYSSPRLNDYYMYFWGCAVSVVAVQIPLWGFRSGVLYEVLQVDPTNADGCIICKTWVKMLVLLVTYVLAVLLWLSAYHYIVRPWMKYRGCSLGAEDSRGCLSHESHEMDKLTADQRHNKSKTVQEVKMHHVYSWLNTNPAYVLKCKYFFKDPRNSAHRRGHPLASGDDEEEVRFFEVGKEYLFLRPERLHLLHANISDFLEPEYWIDRMAWRFGQFADLFRARVKEKVTEVQEQMEQVKGEVNEVVEQGLGELREGWNQARSTHGYASLSPERLSVRS
jgi:hypothetical protein